jgi:hypothetical protein
MQYIELQKILDNALTKFDPKQVCIKRFNEASAIVEVVSFEFETIPNTQRTILIRSEVKKHAPDLDKIMHLVFIAFTPREYNDYLTDFRNTSPSVK